MRNHLDRILLWVTAIVVALVPRRLFGDCQEPMLATVRPIGTELCVGPMFDGHTGYPVRRVPERFCREPMYGCYNPLGYHPSERRDKGSDPSRPWVQPAPRNFRRTR